MEFIRAKGYEEEGSSYLEFEITNGGSEYCSVDSIWCDRTTLLISDFISEYELTMWFEECNIPHKAQQALKGALRRMEII